MRHTSYLIVFWLLVGGCAAPDPDAATDDSAGTAELDPDAGAPPVPLPAGGEHWDFVGTFRLAKGGKAATVRLYVFDSESVANKKAKRDGTRISHYPNSFALHAFYRAGGDEEWAYRELYGGARTRFVQVKAVRADGVDVELAAKFMADLTSGDSWEMLEMLKLVEQANMPYTVRITLEDGGSG